jgi:hypothetical protein
MKEAMAVYAIWMDKNKIKYSRSKRKTRKINEK